MPASAGDSRDVSSIPRSGKSLEGGNGNLLQYSCLGEPHRQRSPVGYSLWDRTESDTTEDDEQLRATKQ